VQSSSKTKSPLKPRSKSRACITSRSSRRRYAPRLNSSVSLKPTKTKIESVQVSRYRGFGIGDEFIMIGVLFLCGFWFVVGSVVCWFLILLFSVARFRWQRFWFHRINDLGFIGQRVSKGLVLALLLCFSGQGQ
jgi:hypothetical protein